MTTLTVFDQFVQWVLNFDERPTTEHEVFQMAIRFASEQDPYDDDPGLAARLVDEWYES